MKHFPVETKTKSGADILVLGVSLQTTFVFSGFPNNRLIAICIFDDQSIGYLGLDELEINLIDYLRTKSK
jgi:hypothetical protein